MRPDYTTADDIQALGRSEAFLVFQERVSRAARTQRPIILIGERGTGKELAAARLHLLSPRWGAPYLTLNCASLSPTLIESELFGHEAGSFTGATRLRKGRFEMADGGSLFLDEVGNIPMPAQEKLLRFVEYGTLERVGSSATLHFDVRLIAATNVDLRAETENGRFRRDLLDRLSFEVIVLPPLRERGGDIALLADHFARRMATALEMPAAPVLTPRALRQLEDYPWPGNIRELKNVIERMVYRSEGEPIDEIVFDPFESPYLPLGGEQPKPAQAPAKPAPSPAEEVAAMLDRIELLEWDAMPMAEAVREFEIRRLKAALAAHRFNQRKAAEALGLTYHQFRGYYRKYHEELGGDDPET